jgi:hypothetical protein
MDQLKINKGYETFLIPQEQLPFYDNPVSFALRFKKFTLLQEVNTIYSDSSSIPLKLNTDQQE